MSCPDGYKQVVGISLLGNPTLKCIPDDSEQAIIDAEEEVANSKSKMDALRKIYRTAQQSQGKVYYPTQTEIPGPPLNVPSRRDQKANLFNSAFDPKNRKIFVLLIAGFLLFLALTNYDG